jgi:CO/xanthine dehydrogenase Mo-binding subunit
LTTSPTNTVVGKPIARVDGPEKTTGRGQYALDTNLPGQLWMKILRSPFPHARITRIDASKALELPGVHAVLTGKDVEGMRTGAAIKDEPVLCWDKVMLVGDKVAAVAADDPDIASAALGLIEVDYEELPAILDPVESTAPGALVLHPEFASYEKMMPLEANGNRYAGIHNERGDVERGFAEADLVLERTYKTPLLHQAYLEPHGCLVQIQDQGSVEIWAANDSPNGAHQEMARLFNLDPDTININFAYVGGSFGGKSTGICIPVAYLLAKKTGRPVKWRADYEEEFQNMTMRHPATMRVKSGVKRDGTITAWEAEIHFAGGGYGAYAPIPAITGIAEIVGPYRIPNTKVDSHQVYTNTSPCTYARSPGHVQAHFAGESHMDVMARAIGMDPLDFRLLNVVGPDDEYPTGEKWENVRAEEALRRAADAAGYGSPKAPGVGRGIAIGSHSQIGASAHVEITVLDNGEVEVAHPVFDSGMGTATIIAQIVSEELSVPMDRIQVKHWSTGGDKKTPDMGIAGSRGARIYSAAAHGASTQAKERIQQLTAEFMGWPEEQITFEDGYVVNGATPAERMPIEDVVRRFGEPIVVRTDEQQGFDSPWLGFGVHVVDVAVDPDSGEIDVQRYTAVQETGRMLNPIGFTGQIEGGLVQSLGTALMEGLVHDEGGRVMNPSFADMKIPTAADIPALNTVVLESDDGHGQYKVRGIGEHTNSMAAPAVANAVADAVGARIQEIPITPESVYRAMGRRSG